MWLYVPGMSCPSAPASPGSTSASSWLCRALARSASWRGKSLPSKSWHRILRRGGWMTRLSGRICKPSAASLGVASWIASLRESPAKVTRSPAGDSSKTTRAISGPPRGESYAQLPNQVAFLTGPQAQPIAPHGNGSLKRGQRSPLRPRLNPIFVEWLMGLPPGWSDGSTVCADLATWLCRSRQLVRFLCCGND